MNTTQSDNTQPRRTRLIGLTLPGLRDLVASLGMPAFSAGQIARWLYQKRATSIDMMTDLSVKNRQKLAEVAEVGLRAPVAEARSADGTVKYLFSGVGGRDVEAVYIPDGDRATLCVSSQAGCRMGCRFCMTGQGGFQGNLTVADIMNQILAIPESEKLTNIVFMGMGEPLDNLDAVMGAIEILTAKWGFAWSPKRITVSTVGANPGALEHLLELTRVHLALSLHNPFTAARAAIMPAERANPATAVLDLLRRHDWSGQRRLSVEYIMWRGVNDDLRHAEAVARLLRGLDARVNLIRFHRIPGFEGAPSSKAVMEAFRDHLNDRGITATIRASRGEDISAACGMLAGRAREQQFRHLNNDN